jgi:aldose sugar dehydrogenase
MQIAEGGAAMAMRIRDLLIHLMAVSALSAAAHAQVVDDPNLTVTAVLPVGSLSLPTQMRFIAPKDFLVTEKNTGCVWRVQNGVLSPTPVLDLAVANDDERGLLGIALDPAFATNHFVYLYYSVTSGGDGGPWVENRLSRFVWSGTTLGSEVSLKTFGTAADGQSPGPSHDAGPITFGLDGLLYGTTGDLGRDRAEQNDQADAGSSAYVGGIYRLNPNGSVPATNPFFSSSNPDFRQWFAYGVRNTYGIAVDPLTGNIWDTENGPEAYDEINLVAAGLNSGWTKIMGPDSRDPEGMSDLVPLPGAFYSDPEFSFFTPVAVTGLAFLANSSWGPSYQDALLVGGNNFAEVYLFRLNANRTGFVLGGGLADLVADSATERQVVEFGSGFGAVTDIQMGPDGAAYVTSIGDGTIYRIVPEPSLGVMLLAGSLALGVCARRRSAPSEAASEPDTTSSAPNQPPVES